MQNPGRRTANAAQAGRSHSVELVVLIGVAGLSFILACGWLVLSRRVKALERAMVTSRSKSAGEDDLSMRVESLASRVGASEKRVRAENTSTVKLESALSRLRAEVDSVKFSQETAPSTADVNDMRASVQALKDEVAQAKDLAETAAQKPKVLPAPDSAGDVTALAARLDTLDARVEELGHKTSSSTTPKTSVNEEQLRTAVNQMVKEAFDKMRAEQRDARRRRPPQQ